MIACFTYCFVLFVFIALQRYEIDNTAIRTFTCKLHSVLKDFINTKDRTRALISRYVCLDERM